MVEAQRALLDELMGTGISPFPYVIKKQFHGKAK